MVWYVHTHIDAESEAKTGGLGSYIGISTLRVDGSELELLRPRLWSLVWSCWLPWCGNFAPESELHQASPSVTKCHQAAAEVRCGWLPCQGRKESDELLEKKDSWLKMAERREREYIYKKIFIYILYIYIYLYMHIFIYIYNNLKKPRTSNTSLTRQTHYGINFLVICNILQPVKLCQACWVGACPGRCDGRFNASADWDGWSWKCWCWIRQWFRWRRSSARAELNGSWCRCLGILGGMWVPKSPKCLISLKIFEGHHVRTQKPFPHHAVSDTDAIWCRLLSQVPLGVVSWAPGNRLNFLLLPHILLCFTCWVAEIFLESVKLPCYIWGFFPVAWTIRSISKGTVPH